MDNWLGRRLRFLRYSVHAIGLPALVRSSLRLAADPEARTHDSGFDGRFGTDTTTGVTPSDAALPDARRNGATMYLPTMDVDLASMLEALAWPDDLITSATFVDIGSGKGRVVLLAAMRRFKEVVGVELSSVLHAIAARNLERVASAGALVSPVRLLLEDAASFPIPDGPLVLYLYHPFREDVAAPLFERVAASLVASPRPAAILYGHPMLQPCLDARVFRIGGLFRKATDGARGTRSFRIGWSIWTNLAWLAIPRTQAA
jgi:SAM-dependent methyltransferase